MEMKYKIFLDSQLGVREGTLRLSDEHGKITGILSLLGFDNEVMGEKEGQTLKLHHRLYTLMRSLDCLTELEISDNALTGMVMAGNIKMKLRGIPVCSEEHDEMKGEIVTGYECEREK